MIAAIGLSVVSLFVGADGSRDAAAALARLSKRGDQLTYYARYGTAATPSDPNSPAGITYYRVPGIGYRFDLPSTIHPDFDDDPLTPELLKGGDIFIWDLAPPGTIISCRTSRQSCRSADGLEVLGALALVTLFSYDVPFFEQPHTVKRAKSITAAGETGACFLIEQRVGSKEERAKASGLVLGVGLPKTFCYAADGLPLGGQVSDDSTKPQTIKAVEVRREVDPAAFAPPYPIVPSEYDRTPRAELSPTFPP